MRPVRLTQARSARLELRPPAHGWLEVTIALGRYCLKSAASWVLNDPLHELLDLATFVARGTSGTRRVSLWHEPDGHALDVWPIGADDTLVRIGYDASFVPPMAGKALGEVHRCTVERSVLADAIHRGVTAALDDERFTFGPPHWSDRKVYRAQRKELDRALRSGRAGTTPARRARARRP